MPDADDGGDFGGRSAERVRLQRVIDGGCAEVRRAAGVSSDELEHAGRGFAVSLRAGGIPVERALAVLLDCVSDLRLSPIDRERLLRRAIGEYHRIE
jgi:hypothetical protein